MSYAYVRVDMCAATSSGEIGKDKKNREKREEMKRLISPEFACLIPLFSQNFFFFLWHRKDYMIHIVGAIIIFFVHHYRLDLKAI
jgi:hypothetical protein